MIGDNKMSAGHHIYTTKFSADIFKFQQVAGDDHLNKTAFRIFIFLACQLDSHHVRKIDFDQVAKTLSISKKDVKKAVDDLDDAGIIVKDSDEHVKKGYRFSYTDDEYESCRYQ